MSITYARMLILAVRGHVRASGKTGQAGPTREIADCSRWKGEQHCSSMCRKRGGRRTGATDPLVMQTIGPYEDLGEVGAQVPGQGAVQV